MFHFTPNQGIAYKGMEMQKSEKSDSNFVQLSFAIGLRISGSLDFIFVPVQNLISGRVFMSETVLSRFSAEPCPWFLFI